MKQKIIGLFTIIFMVITFSFFTFKTKAMTNTTPVYDIYYNNGAGAFFANGTPITISDVDGVTTITWDEGSQIITQNTTIFGGGIEGTDFDFSQITLESGIVSYVYGGGFSTNSASPAKVTNCTITIKGGIIKNSLFAGGLLYSQVSTANVIIDDGTINSASAGGGASGTISGISYSTGTKENPQDSGTIVTSSNLIINNGTIQFLWGGGQGYANTQSSKLTIYNGIINYITAGGANGYTGSCQVFINGGTISLYQSINRGLVDFVNVKMTNGSVSQFYVSGENSSDVTGTLMKINAYLLGGEILNLSPGLSSSQPFEIAENSIIFVDSVIKNAPTITIPLTQIDFSLSLTDSIIHLNENEEKKVEVIVTTTPSGYESIFEDITPNLTSLNPDVVQISSNKVITGVHEGTTQITAQLMNKTATANVMVTNHHPKIIVIISFSILVLGILLPIVFFILFSL